MNLRRFISSVLFSGAVSAALACGPFYSIASNPFVFHFYQEDEEPTLNILQKNENLRLWQAETSASVPLAQIEEAVYGLSLSELKEAFKSEKSHNRFLSWIIRSRRDDIRDFLLLAKEVEELRANRASKWFYPADKTGPYESPGEARQYTDVLDRCKKHTSGSLSDRYGLQCVRALFSLGRYDDCLVFYSENMSKLPDGNLFKKMAKGYAAGCLLREGRVEEANRMFAEVGDFNSIMANKRAYFVTLVANNPESEVVKSRLNHWIGYDGAEANRPFLAVADAALNSPRTIHRGDWLYLKAFVEEIYNGQHTKALAYLDEALKGTFSRKEMRSDAKIMKFCLEAEQGKLCGDLREYIRAFGSKTEPLFFYIVPELLRQGRVSEALLLANYASGVRDTHDNDEYPFLSLTNYSYNKEEISNNDYANTGFQLMLSRSSKEIIAYKAFLSTAGDLVKACSGKVKDDGDYLNEIIGTLLLREGNYPEAAKYFSQVSEGYQDKLNVKTCGYLRDNPWVNCYIPADKWEYPASEAAETDTVASLIASFYPANSSRLKSDRNAKLNFAREMSRLENIMATGSPDQKGLARIRHAIARHNSFVSCWALTQYWLGNSNQCNFRLSYWTWDGGYKELKYLRDLPEQMPDDRWLNEEISKGMAELQNPDAKAEARFLTGNYRAIARQYPHTPAAKYLSAHCDAWKDWL